MRVNLIAEKKKGISFDFLKVGLTLALAGTIMLIALTHYSLISDRDAVNREINDIESQLTIFLPKEEEYKEYEQLIEKIKSTPEVPNYIWDGPVEALGYILPMRATIDSFSLKERLLSIRGRTRIAEELRTFKNRLTNSPHFNNVILQTLEKQEYVMFIISAELAEKEGDD